LGINGKSGYLFREKIPWIHCRRTYEEIVAPLTDERELTYPQSDGSQSVLTNPDSAESDTARD